MHPAALLTLAGTISYAFFGIITRRLAAHDSSATTTVYSGFVGIVAMTAAPAVDLDRDPVAG